MTHTISFSFIPLWDLTHLRVYKHKRCKKNNQIVKLECFRECSNYYLGNIKYKHKIQVSKHIENNSILYNTWIKKEASSGN